MYITAGVIVLAVGTWGVTSMRGESGPTVDPITIASAGSGSESIAGEGGRIASSTTTSTSLARIWVQVAGAVRGPGVYEMTAGSRVYEAVERAGGFSEDADREVLTLAARLTDGCRVYVPRVGEVATGGVVPLEEQTASATMADGAVVSINSATVDELDSLPGVGPAIANDIVNYRETNGPFTSVDQLTDVPGIGPAKLEQLRPLVGL